MPNRETILETLAEHRSSLHALGVRRLGLFGSHARGEARENSDLDVLVEFQAGAKTFDNYMGLKALIEDLFGTHVESPPYHPEGASAAEGSGRAAGFPRPGPSSSLGSPSG
jgi:hypothetical protein